jgi:hypothetical protein
MKRQMLYAEYTRYQSTISAGAVATNPIKSSVDFIRIDIGKRMSTDAAPYAFIAAPSTLVTCGCLNNASPTQ